MTIINEGDSTEPFSGFSTNFGDTNAFGSSNDWFEKARNDFFGRESSFEKSGLSSGLSSDFGKGFGDSSFGKDTVFGKTSNFGKENRRNNTKQPVNAASRPRIEKPARTSNVTNGEFQVNVPVEDYRK